MVRFYLASTNSKYLSCSGVESVEDRRRGDVVCDFGKVIIEQ